MDRYESLSKMSLYRLKFHCSQHSCACVCRFVVPPRTRNSVCDSRGCEVSCSWTDRFFLRGAGEPGAGGESFLSAGTRSAANAGRKPTRSCPKAAQFPARRTSEIGSHSYCGKRGVFLGDVLPERKWKSQESASFEVLADRRSAEGQHPG